MQFSSDYLDLAIGLATVFFLVSLVVSALAEGIQWPLRVRSKFLWAYLYDLTSGTRTHVLPRSKAGIIALWGKRADKRPLTGLSGVGGSAVPATGLTSEAGGLQRLARSLDPIDAPELTRPTRDDPVQGSATADAARGHRTSIQNIPPRSLAQGFLEVFAEAGRIPLDAAVGRFQTAYAAGDDAARHDAARTLGELLARSSRATPAGSPAPNAPATATQITEAFDAYAGSVRTATDRAALGTASETLAMTLRRLPDVEGRHDVAPDAEAFALFLRPELADPEHPSPKFDDADAACRWLVTGILRSAPRQFSRQRIDNALEGLGDSPLGVTARRLWEAAERDIDAFRTSLENHFDSEMSRLSGFYKRSIRVVLIILAVFVAVVGNIDVLRVAEGLWRNPDGRAALIAQADGLAQGEPTAGATPSDATAVGDDGSPTLALLQERCRALAPVGEGDADPAEVAAGLQKVRDCVDDELTALSGLGVIDRSLFVSPSSWLDDVLPAYRSEGENSGDWGLHFLGIALTAAALVLGSSFWFDLIKRLTGLRKGLVGQT